MNRARSGIYYLLLLTICLSCRSAAASELGAGQVILVLWHGLEWEQISEFSCSAPLSIGIMNTRSGGGGDEPSASYLSISAGARAVGGFADAAAFSAGGNRPAMFTGCVQVANRLCMFNPT